VLLDQAISAAAAVAVAVSLRRLDVALWFPAFILLRVFNSAVLLHSFWSEVIRKRRLQTWFSVGRYDINERRSYASIRAFIS
jgi:hypothetical protein